MERKNIYIVILTITTIISACFAIYFYINQNNENIISNNISKKLEEKNETEEDLNEKIVEKIVYKYKLPNIDETKCINPRDGIKYIIKRKALSSDNICTATLVNSKEVSITINWYDAQKQYGVTMPDTVNDIITTETKSITNFNGNVINIYISNLGQGLEPVLFFLMDDGTVEYMPIIKALGKNVYESYGKLENVEDVVEIIEASTNYTGECPVALKQDGTFYDLAKIINK